MILFFTTRFPTKRMYDKVLPESERSIVFVIQQFGTDNSPLGLQIQRLQSSRQNFPAWELTAFD